MWRAALLGAFGFLFSLVTVVFHNDHFGRISPGRQIAEYGELPFRDFLDPGYFLTEFSSAAMLALFGDSLLGEALLTSTFVALGTVLVFLLARRVSGSSLLALTAAVLALLLLSRAYDYDKVLFYPLGIFLCWRYVDQPCAARVWMLAAGLVAGALYRYDTGVYIAGSGLVAIAVVHAGDWRVLARRGFMLGLASACLVLPVLGWLHVNGGIGNAVDQMVTYGRRETARTQLSAPLRFSAGPIIAFARLPKSNAVLVRWAQSVDEAARRAAETRYGLTDASPRGEPEARTWEYRLVNTSSPSIRALLADPAVQNTAGIDRHSFRLTPEPLWTRVQRALPVLQARVLPGAWHAANANVFLYYLYRALPLVAVVVLMLGQRAGAPGTREERARVTSLIAMCVALNVFILREPVGARVGGMAGPAAVLAVWIVHVAGRWPTMVTRRLLQTAIAVVFAITVLSISASADWQHQLRPELLRPAHVAGVVRMLATSPPSSTAYRPLVSYLRECTAPGDRVLVTWFAPEVYFLAQRGFAAGLTVVFGEHWSEPRFQARSLRAWASQSVPIVITRTGDPALDQNYPLLGQYLSEHYRKAGTTGFGDGEHPDGYTVFVIRDRTPSDVHYATSMPCFR